MATITTVQQQSNPEEKKYICSVCNLSYKTPIALQICTCRHAREASRQGAGKGSRGVGRKSPSLTTPWPRPDRKFPNRSTEHFCKCSICGRTDAIHTIWFSIAWDGLECRRCGVVYDSNRGWSDKARKDIPFHCEYIGLIPGTSEWNIDRKLQKGADIDVDPYALPYIYCCSGRFSGILP
jgi:hypothetical protein